MVDDLGIKCTDKADVDFLIASLEEVYTMTLDMEGKKHCGLNLDWDYLERSVTLSMDGYVLEALAELGHTKPKQYFYGQSKMERPDYGATIQYVKENQRRPLNASQSTTCNELWGSSYTYDEPSIIPHYIHSMKLTLPPLRVLKQH